MRKHRDFFPQRAEVEAGLQPLDTKYHDILVVQQARGKGDPVHGPNEFVRIPVVKTAHDGHKPGEYVSPPEVWNDQDAGQRKVLSIAHPERSTPQPDIPRGAAFAILPVKPEPASSSCAICYLINADNFVAPNAWTAEEWVAPSDEDLPAGPNADADRAEVMLGLPCGIVIAIEIDGLRTLAGVADLKALKPVDASVGGLNVKVRPVHLGSEAEIWTQLRSGCIAGRVWSNAKGDVVPLVNLTALMPEPAAKP